MRVQAILLWSVLLATTATASGRIEAGPVSLLVENGHEEHCVEDASGLCLASLRRGAVGDTELNATQRVARLVIAYDAPALNALLPAPLLPGGELMVDAAEVSVQHPLLVLATGVVGSRGAPTPWGNASVGLSSEGIHLAYLGVDEARVAPEPHTHHYNYTDHGIRYRELGPFHRTGGPVRSDDVLAAPDDACRHANEVPCPAAPHAGPELESMTPSVILGQELHRAGVSGDPHATSRAIVSRQAPDAPVEPIRRASPPAPARTGTPPALTALAVDRMPSTRLAAGESPEGTSTPRARADPTALLEAAPRPPRALPLAPLAASFALAAALAALYSRFRSRQEALAHEARQRILLLVEEEPRTIANLAGILGVDRSTVQYHARVMARTGVVAIRKDDRNVFVTLPGQALPSKPIVTIGAPARIVELLRAAGGAMPRAALHDQAADLPHRTRNHALRELVERGVVERRFAGNEELVALAPSPPEAHLRAPVTSG